jgi:gas vesicle protein
MINPNQEPETHNNTVLGVLAGMLIGSLAGAITMLLFAPQSGKRTRMQIKEKGIELRDQAIGMVEDGVAQVRLGANKVVRNGRRKANHLMRQGQSLVADQLEYVSDSVKAGKKAIQNSQG